MTFLLTVLLSGYGNPRFQDLVSDWPNAAVLIAIIMSSAIFASVLVIAAVWFFSILIKS